MLSERSKKMTAKLIRLLGSDKDGEILAGVGALKRVLKSEGLSFHELADIVFGPDVPDDLQTLCERCLVLVDNAKERGFVMSILHRTRADQKFRPSAGQMSWLESIAARKKVP
jgi:hypothetical protein